MNPARPSRNQEEKQDLATDETQIKHRLKGKAERCLLAVFEIFV